MLQDRPRCRAYAESIQQPNFAGKIVLDVGTGTGFLAMLAAKKGGAKHVHAVEANDDIANVARRLIKANGLQDVITVHSCPVEKLSLPEKVDIIISEWMGFYLFHETMLESVLFARDKFLAEGGRLYPERCTLWACPIDTSDYFTDLYGIDFSSVFSTCMDAPDITRIIQPDNLLSEPQQIVTLDLMAVKASELSVFKKSLKFTSRAGSFAGVGLWFDCRFPAPSENSRTEENQDSNRIVLDTGPSSPPTHWKQTIIYLGSSFPVPAGESICFTLELTQAQENKRQYQLDLRM